MSSCGVFNCGTCSYALRGRCLGCAKGNEIRLADGNDQCAIHVCAESRGLGSCEQCTASVCQFTRNLETVCPVRANFEKGRCFKHKLAEHFLNRHYSRKAAPHGVKVSDKTITRLRWYLFALDDFLKHDVYRVSSDDISRKVNVRAWVIRRDLSQFGTFGRPSVGYDAAFLRDRLAEILHLDSPKNLIWIGAHQLLGNPSLIDQVEAYGFKVIAVVDPDPSRTPDAVGGMEVQPLDAIPRIAEDMKANAGVIAVSDEESQTAADALVSAGIPAILDLTPSVITVPPDIRVRHVDVVTELCALSYYCGEQIQTQESVPTPDGVLPTVDVELSATLLTEKLADTGSSVSD